nr:scarecrow-like protein 21 [Ipomoea batatas]
MLKVEKRVKVVAEVAEVEEHDKGGGLHLIHLLLVSATAVDENTPGPAAESLSELYRRASLSGDAVQRVAAYFADGLVARLLTRKSPFYDMIMKPPTPHEHLFAFTHLYRASPFHQFAHFTANQAIIEAFHQESQTNNASLHVIDFDVSHGFQWPSLIQSLSQSLSPPSKISLKITGFGPSLSQLRETEARLVSFAKGFRNLSFEFTGLLLDSIDYYTLAKTKTKTKTHETVAVNLAFYLNRLPNFSDTLRSVHLLSPSVVTLVEQEGCRSPRNFLSRFMESLHYFAAMFDSLDDCLPIDSPERLSIEKNYLGNEIKRAMTNNGSEELVPRYEKMDTWKARMESHGFCGVRLSCKNVMQAKLLLKIASSGHCCRVSFDGGFRVFERDDGKAISLAWQDKPLTTASVWRCV